MEIFAQLLASLRAFFGLSPIMQTNPPTPNPTPETAAVLGWPQQVSAAIHSETVPLLGIPQDAAEILVTQSSHETGAWKAWYFAGVQPDGLPPTYNLVNRRRGTSRGDWTHTVKIVGGDDIRIYSDVKQAARDLAQLLSDPLYARALVALRANNGGQYFRELEAVGFSARRGDYAAYAQQWEEQHA